MIHLSVAEVRSEVEAECILWTSGLCFGLDGVDSEEPSPDIGETGLAADLDMSLEWIGGLRSAARVLKGPWSLGSEQRFGRQD